MNVILKNLLLMEKQEKRDKDNNLNYEIVCFQKGYKQLVTIKDIPLDLFSVLEEGSSIDVECKMIVWGNNNNYGASFRFLNLVD